MESEADPFEFVLAENLGMTVTDLRERMPNQEYVQWRAFTKYRNALQEIEHKKAEAKRRRG